MSGPKLRAVWLEANQQYATVFGDEFSDVRGRIFYDSKKDLRSWLAASGLKLERNGVITKDPAYEEPYLSDAEVEMLEALEDERLLQEVNALLDAEANTPEDNLTPTP